MRKKTAGLLALMMILICSVSLADGNIAAGDKVTFGQYRQHMVSRDVPANPEPIVWLVLAVNGDRALLLADQPLVGMPYNSEDHFLYEVTWETCSLRAWLNDEFLNDAFSPEEQRAIPETAVTTPDFANNGFVVSGGNDTADKVFVLSTEELEKYLKTDKNRICCPTDYAVYYTGASNSWGFYHDDSLRVDEYIDDVCIWWLRSPGEIGHYTAVCNFDGSIDDYGEYSARDGISVRPAIWVLTSALAGR